MPLEPTIKDLGDLLEALTKEIPLQQQRLNHDFLDRLEEFAPVYEMCRALGFENLALAVAPKQSVLDQIEIETSFRIASSREKQISLNVQPLNLGFTRRFAYSGFVQHRLQVSVQKIPSEPGNAFQKNDNI
jgi:hypothetical protein